MCKLVHLKTNYGKDVLVADTKLGFIKEILESAMKSKDILKVILFGSSITTDCREDSDVDFCVFVDSRDSWVRSIDASSFVDKLLDYDIDQEYDMLIKDNYNCNSLVEEEIIDRGVTIYERC